MLDVVLSLPTQENRMWRVLKGRFSHCSIPSGFLRGLGGRRSDAQSQEDESEHGFHTAGLPSQLIERPAL